MIAISIKWFAFFCICLILQTSLIPLIAILGIQPDLLFALLFFICMKHGVIPGIFTGFFMGLGLDLYAPALLGQHALSKTVTGFFLGNFNEKIFRTDPILKTIIIIIGFLLHDTLFNGIQLLKNGEQLSHILIQLLTVTIPRAVYTIIIILLVYFWDSEIKPNLRR